MRVHVKIASDFVCPYCYVLETMLDRLRPELEVEIEYLPFELTEPPAPQVDTYNDPERRKRYARELEPLCRQLGLKMCLPPQVTPRPYTRLAFRGLYLAREQGLEESYCRRVFRAYFEEERDGPGRFPADAGGGPLGGGGAGGRGLCEADASGAGSSHPLSGGAPSGGRRTVSG